MKSHIFIAASVLLLFTASCKKDTAKPEAMADEPIDVAQVVVDSIMLSKDFPGTISAQNQADIVGRVNGYLREQLYNGGDAVRKGQVLFRIEDTQYRDAVMQAEAALQDAQSTYEYAKKHYEAMERALESDAVAQIQVIQAKSAYEQAEAAITNAQAALETARTNLSYCTVRAPFDGSVTKCPYSPGAYIGGAGAPVTLATIYDNSHMFAIFYIEDNAYAKAFTNENNRSLINYDNVPVKFSETLPHSYAGKLSYIAPSINTSTGTMMLRISLDSPYGELRDGMYCTVNLPYKIDPHAILVKDAAIGSTQTNKYLYVVNDSNQVVYTPIEVGSMANDSMRIVTSGLNGDERYVTKALLKVRPGMTIKPVLTK